MQKLIRYGLDSRRVGEIRLVLERKIVEAVAAIQLSDLAPHALRLQPDPFAVVDERIGAEGASKRAALGGDVIELSLALELVIALDGEHAIVVRTQGVEIGERARRVLADGTVRGANGAAGEIRNRFP